MGYGYTGKILRVDLTKARVTVEHPEDDFYRQYLGGAAFIAHFLLKEQESQIDPFDPQSMLIFANGVITGTPVAGSGRNAVGGKSPLTGTFMSSEVGGYWGAELKHAGYDAILIQGQAAKPVYLFIQDDAVDIRDAAHLWGKTTGATQKLIADEVGISNIRTALIGPAGEKRVRFACILNDLRHSVGRGGMGAVMGAKNLKGIAIKGGQSSESADPDGVKEIVRWFGDSFMDLAGGLYKEGTLGGIPEYSKAGGLPVRNFREGVFAGADKISADTYLKTIKSGRSGCYACPVRCKQVVTVGEPYNVDAVYGGPEFETVLALGSNCGIDDLGAIAKANEIANAYGVDTIDLGGVIAFAMECAEEGILTEKETQDLDLSFGNAQAMLKVTEMICGREGIGDLLAEGSARAARHLGKGAQDFAMHCKGAQLPMHSPYYKQVTGLGYALSPTGADHIRNLLHVQYLEEPGFLLNKYKTFGIFRPRPKEDFSSPDRIRLYMYISNWQTVYDCMGMYLFVGNACGPNRVGEIVEKVTGWNTTVWELMKTGERCMNMMRAFNVREGLKREDDRLPPRLHKALASGPLKGARFDPDEFEKAKETYYLMMGWNSQGKPTLAKLQELGIEWVAEAMTA